MGCSQSNIKMQNLTPEQQQVVFQIRKNITKLDHLKFQSQQEELNSSNKVQSLRKQAKHLIIENKQNQVNLLLEKIIVEQKIMKKIELKRKLGQKIYNDLKMLQEQAKIFATDEKTVDKQNQFKQLQTKLKLAEAQQDKISKQIDDSSNTNSVGIKSNEELRKELKEQAENDLKKTKQQNQKISQPKSPIKSPKKQQKLKNSDNKQAIQPHAKPGDHSHHHHVEPPLIITIKDLIDPTPYLLNTLKTKQKIQAYYMKNGQCYTDYWKKHYGIQFNPEAYQLINLDIVIDMEEFLKQNWVQCQYIGFSGCKIDQTKWRMFVAHSHLFPKLKWLSLKLKHTIDVKQGDLEAFKALQRIQFTYEEWTHPLTVHSKNYLKSYAKTHPNVQVVFG